MTGLTSITKSRSQMTEKKTSLLTGVGLSDSVLTYRQYPSVNPAFITNLTTEDFLQIFRKMRNLAMLPTPGAPLELSITGLLSTEKQLISNMSNILAEIGLSQAAGGAAQESQQGRFFHIAFANKDGYNIEISIAHDYRSGTGAGHSGDTSSEQNVGGPLHTNHRIVFEVENTLTDGDRFDYFLKASDNTAPQNEDKGKACQNPPSETVPLHEFRLQDAETGGNSLLVHEAAAIKTAHDEKKKTQNMFEREILIALGKSVELEKPVEQPEEVLQPQQGDVEASPEELQALSEKTQEMLHAVMQTIRQRLVVRQTGQALNKARQDLQNIKKSGDARQHNLDRFEIEAKAKISDLEKRLKEETEALQAARIAEAEETLIIDCVKDENPGAYQTLQGLLRSFSEDVWRKEVVRLKLKTEQEEADRQRSVNKNKADLKEQLTDIRRMHEQKWQSRKSQGQRLQDTASVMDMVVAAGRRGPLSTDVSRVNYYGSFSEMLGMRRTEEKAPSILAELRMLTQLRALAQRAALPEAPATTVESRPSATIVERRPPEAEPEINTDNLFHFIPDDPVIQAGEAETNAPRQESDAVATAADAEQQDVLSSVEDGTGMFVHSGIGYDSDEDDPLRGITGQPDHFMGGRMSPTGSPRFGSDDGNNFF